MQILPTIVIALFLSCSLVDNKQYATDTIRSDTNNVQKANAGILHFHKLDKLYTVGDFDGDGKIDTIYQHDFSKLRQEEIDSSVDPSKNSWDTVTKWFFAQQADVYLTINNHKADTLHLGTGQGLYCLINIGDNNGDHKDEIAFVVDYCDFSQVNSCRIYTLCNHKWYELKQFGVHEDAFILTSDSIPIFKNIKDYLEKRNGKWFYLDYDKEMIEGGEKMKPLQLSKCK